MNGIYHIKGTVKNYDWGGFSFIPSLLNQANTGKKPFAEYWLGTHPQGQAQLDNAGHSLLKDQTGELPFLLKILDVKDMLSIQVHPSRAGAREGFERENKKGIPLDSPQRNYRDPNHKPELMVALDEFWLLHGFKAPEQMAETLSNVSELNSFQSVYLKQGYAALYAEVMQMPQEGVNKILNPLVDRILPLYKEDKLKKDTADFWAARAAMSFVKNGEIDRGIFSIYFFNLLKLNKGEGIFQGAGVPHAYLEGRNVEIMASSDNVLRGGLTNKHIDVPELMKHIACEAINPHIIKPVGQDGEMIYETPASDFQLGLIELNKGEEVSLSLTKPGIVLLTNGVIRIETGERKLIRSDKRIVLRPGNPAVYITENNIRLSADEDSMLFHAS